MTAFTFYQLAKTQTYEFIGNLFQFGAPGNDTMFNLIILFSELMFIGFAITYLLFEVFEVIIDEFSSDYKRMPSNFTSEVESFLDIFFLLFPTAVIIYILIPTLGFIYSEDLTADSSYAITITVVGHQ
jgi:heme/copper-type cytochrome/quinol oxidase subunit 2